MMQIKKYLVLLLSLSLLAAPSTAAAAIAFDSGEGTEPITVTSPYTQSTHTASGSNRILFVHLITSAVTTGVSVTYDGVSMTLLTATQTGTAYKGYVFYLIAPNTTARAVTSVTFSGQLIDYAAASYTGASQAADVIQDVAGHVQKGTASAASYTSQIDSSQATSQDNSWQLGIVWIEATSVIAGAATTLRVNPGAANLSLFTDNNAAITPAGTNSLNWTPSVSQRGAWISWTVAPAVAVAAASSYGTVVLFGDW